MKTEGQDITSGYPTVREAIQRTSPTLVRLSQLTEQNRVYGLEEKRQGKRKIGWSQAIYPLRARFQELKSHLLSEKGDEVLEDEFMELKSGEQAFMATRPKLIQAGYTLAGMTMSKLTDKYTIKRNKIRNQITLL